jgi:hypothetical protein
MEDKEIELLFEQLWNIPQHLAKPPTRGEAYINPLSSLGFAVLPLRRHCHQRDQPYATWGLKSVSL